MIIQGVIPFNQFKNIIDYYKPFDTGYMYTNGNRYNITNDYTMTRYDLIAVPYIRYQEEGTKFFDGNKGFIQVDTMQALNRAASMGGLDGGVASKYEEANKARTSMISNGVMTHNKSYGQQGGSYREYIGKP